jgi:hypothetical protein
MWAGETHQLSDHLVGDIDAVKVRAQQLLALGVVGAFKRLCPSSAPDNGWVQRCLPVSAKEDQYAPGMSAKIIHFLDDGIYGNLVFMMALGGFPGRSKGIAFVDDEERVAVLPACLTTASNASLSRLLISPTLPDPRTRVLSLNNVASRSASRASRSQTPSAVTVLPVPTSPAKITRGIPIGNDGANSEFLVVMLLAPGPHLLGIGEEPKIPVNALVPAFKAD